MKSVLYSLHNHLLLIPANGKKKFRICWLPVRLKIMKKLRNKIMSFALNEICTIEDESNLLTIVTAFPVNHILKN